MCGDYILDINKILRTGYFDTIKIDGTIKPVMGSTGTIISGDDTFRSSLEQSSEKFKHGVAHLRLQLTGESKIDANIEELEEMREDREENGIKRLTGTQFVDRYLIAYADILILKSNYSLPYKLSASGKDEESLIALGNTPDIKELLISSLELADKIESKYSYPKDCIAIAIVNKVYVIPIFRRSGISTWIHQNIADLINMYAMMFPTGIMLMYGDFSHEAGKLFKMENATYNKMLKNHYKKLGYKVFNGGSNGMMPVEMSSIMYKLFI